MAASAPVRLGDLARGRHPRRLEGRSPGEHRNHFRSPASTAKRFHLWRVLAMATSEEATQQLVGQLNSKEPETKNYKETEYKEICSSHRAITDFRAKLLGLLPIATGTAIFFFLKERPDPAYVWAIGLFGFVATAGLAIHEFYAMHQCTNLVERGKCLEADLGLYGGQFGEQLKLDKGTKANRYICSL